VLNLFTSTVSQLLLYFLQAFRDLFHISLTGMLKNRLRLTCSRSLVICRKKKDEDEEASQINKWRSRSRSDSFLFISISALLPSQPFATVFSNEQARGLAAIQSLNIRRAALDEILIRFSL
jgi:hypothetical protein